METRRSRTLSATCGGGTHQDGVDFALHGFAVRGREKKGVSAEQDDTAAPGAFLNPARSLPQPLPGASEAIAVPRPLQTLRAHPGASGNAKMGTLEYQEPKAACIRG